VELLGQQRSPESPRQKENISFGLPQIAINKIKLKTHWISN